jgi:hypothetical protein
LADWQADEKSRTIPQGSCGFFMAFSMRSSTLSGKKRGAARRAGYIDVLHGKDEAKAFLVLGVNPYHVPPAA